ncbi:CDP-alcohol phosphatidyltransferase class-I family protein [Tolypocladium capitatum]|uniref:CDP-alcohol phosphatidyltransferase class-I family protein n=1 Tax=Tolypocladium capitatum TaxID=45235 RepID=A0A2K3Q7R1_9HYPO|nr:CDP-alcohol phosphatidyltransferase class-I family protein [Tolypocladium capitatum]
MSPRCLARLAAHAPVPLPLGSAMSQRFAKGGAAAAAAALTKPSARRCGPFAVAGQQQWRRSSSKTATPTPTPTPTPTTAKSSQPPASTTQVDAGLGKPKPESRRAPDGAVLHEDIYNIPNFLTFTRLVAAPVIGYLVLHDAHAWAVGLFAYAGVTDLLDGWIARRWNRKTVVGTVIDPMADKALMTILTVCLAVKGAMPVWVATVILGRDVGLGIAAIYYRWISLPPPKTFARYWDFSLPSAEVRPTTISKYNTFLQLALVGLTITAPLVDADMTLALTTVQYAAARRNSLCSPSRVADQQAGTSWQPLQSGAVQATSSAKTP